jgi:hypothetical protein
MISKKQSIHDFGPHLEKILVRMCKVVGADPNTIDFKTDNWYHLYSWTPETEAKFKEWMVKYLRTTAAARSELFGHGTYVRKELLEREVDMFNLNYGWKTKNYEDIEWEQD